MLLKDEYKINISDLKCQSIVGIYDHEKYSKQTILIDLELVIKGTDNIDSDNINNTCDYNIIASKIVDFLSDNKFLLIEKIAHDVLEICFNLSEKIYSAKISVKKPKALEEYNSLVSTTLEARRS
jgi:FolB domain-containing protein